MIRYKCPGCGRAASAVDSMAGGFLACGQCNQAIEVPAKVKRRKDRTDPLIALGLGGTTTHTCTHCGQTILSGKELLDKQSCARCGKPMRQEVCAGSDDMIRFQCNGCHKQLKAPSHAAGKGATCRRCGGRVCIPKLGLVERKPSVFMF